MRAKSLIRAKHGFFCGQHGGTWYCGNNGARLFFPGIKVRRRWLIPSGTACQLCGRIYVSKGYLVYGFDRDDFVHEYGHYLQEKEMGFWRYLFRVAIPSAIDMKLHPTQHHLPWYERDATQRGHAFLHKLLMAK